MITFRFYIVSVVAFFLAIAVGVVLGSALDGRISESLKDRLERVEGNLNDTVGVIDEKNAQIDQLTTFGTDVMPYAVQGRLDATNTLVVAQNGVKVDQVKRVVAALNASGTATPGVMWINKDWDPSDREFANRVRPILAAGGEPVGSDDLEDAVWSAIIDAITVPDETPSDAEGAGQVPTGESPPADTEADGTTATTTGETTTVAPTTTIPPTTQVATGTEPGSGTEVLAAQTWWEQTLLADLAGTSILSLDGLNQTDGEPGSLNIVIIVGADSELDNDDSEMISLARLAGARGIPTVIAEIDPADPDPDEDPSVLAGIVKKIDAGTVSAVQGSDQVSGGVAVVGALANAAQGEFGVFGTGPLATSVLPPLLVDDSGS